MDALDLWRLVRSLPQTCDDGRSESAGGWAGGGLEGWRTGRTGLGLSGSLQT